MTLRYVYVRSGSLDTREFVSLLGMIKWCHGQNFFYIYKFYPGEHSREFLRVYLFYQRNERKCLNDFRTVLLHLVKSSERVEWNFKELLRNDKKKRTTIPIAYFKVHWNGRPLVARKEIAFSYIFWSRPLKNSPVDFAETFRFHSRQTNLIIFTIFCHFRSRFMKDLMFYLLTIFLKKCKKNFF